MSDGFILSVMGESEIETFEVQLKNKRMSSQVHNKIEDQVNWLGSILDVGADTNLTQAHKENIAYIHTDIRAMPKNKKVWSSWNSSIDDKDVEKNSISYWLNLLQNLKCEQDIFLTLNPYFEIDKSKILKKVRFTHPYYDQKALDTQHELSKLQNQKDLLFCGSYFGYGFHEDGIKSSIEMLNNLND